MKFCASLILLAGLLLALEPATCRAQCPCTGAAVCQCGPGCGCSAAPARRSFAPIYLITPTYVYPNTYYVQPFPARSVYPTYYRPVYRPVYCAPTRAYAPAFTRRLAFAAGCST